MIRDSISKLDVWIITAFIILVVFFSFPYSVSNAIVKTEAQISSDCSESYTIKGDKNVTVYHCDNKINNNDAVARSIINGDIIQVEEETVGEYGGYMILHELGHNLGYTHTERGIMDPSPTEEFNSELSSKEISIAKSFEGLKIIDWSNEEDRSYMISENKEYKNIEKQNCRSIYYKDSLYKEWWEGDRIYNKCI